MTGKQLFTQAMSLLGYSGSEGIDNQSDRLSRMQAIVSAIYCELCVLCGLSPIAVTDVNTPLTLPEQLLNDCFVYGVAAAAAISEDDPDNARTFSGIYEYKKSCFAKRSSSSEIVDVLPIVGGD